MIEVLITDAARTNQRTVTRRRDFIANKCEVDRVSVDLGYRGKEDMVSLKVLGGSSSTPPALETRLSRADALLLAEALAAAATNLDVIGMVVADTAKPDSVGTKTKVEPMHTPATPVTSNARAPRSTEAGTAETEEEDDEEDVAAEEVVQAPTITSRPVPAPPTTPAPNQLTLPITFAAAGVQFEGRADRIRSLIAGREIQAIRRPDNPHDTNAIELTDQHGQSVGWVPRLIAARLAPDMDGGRRIRATVTNSSVEPGRLHLGVQITEVR
jgi:hypothetical protein